MSKENTNRIVQGSGLLYLSFIKNGHSYWKQPMIYTVRKKMENKGEKRKEIGDNFLCFSFPLFLPVSFECVFDLKATAKG